MYTTGDKGESRTRYGAIGTTFINSEKHLPVFQQRKTFITTHRGCYNGIYLAFFTAHKHSPCTSPSPLWNHVSALQYVRYEMQTNRQSMARNTNPRLTARSNKWVPIITMHLSDCGWQYVVLSHPDIQGLRMLTCLQKAQSFEIGVWWAAVSKCIKECFGHQPV